MGNQSVAIVRKTTTVSITFVEKPSEQQRQQLKDKGYRFENGNWYKSASLGQHADAEQVAQIILATS